MSSIERTHLVLQPFRAVHVNSDRQGRGKEGRAFDLRMANVEDVPKPPVEPIETPAASGGDEEGVGARVNIVA